MILDSVIKSSNVLRKSNLGGILAGEPPDDGGVTAGGQPARRPIAIYKHPTGELVRWIRSRPDGFFLTNFVPPGDYFIIAFDSERIYNASIRDRVQPFILPDE